MKETDFVGGWKDKLLETYPGRSWFYKIPTGMYGGYRPFDSLAVLKAQERDVPGYPDAANERWPILFHFAIEFKVERADEPILTPERLKEEYKHQHHSLFHAAPYFITLFILYSERNKEVVFTPVGWDPKDRPWVFDTLNFWSKEARKAKVEGSKIAE